MTQNKKLILKYAFYLFLFGVCYFLFILIHKLYTKNPLGHYFTNIYYQDHDAAVFISSLFKTPFLNMYIVYYSFIFFIAITACILLYVCKPLHSFTSKNEVLPIAVICIFILSTILQTKTQCQDYKAYFYEYHGQPLAVKYRDLFREASLWPELFSFAQFCRKNIPPNSKIELVTDLNFEVDPGMFYNRALRYFLYPIDTNHLREGAINYLIFFGKNNAKNFIPPHYTITAVFDEDNLIAKKE